ncbi:hypothetical protein G6F57_018148 [Rhizopus arrhizus]|nr:hypothetical protein G6F57_018148 [Rhizopus arrhizus]
MKQAIDAQHGGAQFRQAVDAPCPGLAARQQHLVRQRSNQEQRELRGEDAVRPRVCHADTGCDKHRAQCQRGRQQRYQPAGGVQHEGGHQIEAHLHAQRPRLRHQQPLIQGHLAMREAAREDQG